MSAFSRHLVIFRGHLCSVREKGGGFEQLTV